MGFKPSEKVLVSLRGVYNLPFNLDDPVERSINLCWVRLGLGILWRPCLTDAEMR